jgi:hypothetical protein
MVVCTILLVVDRFKDTSHFIKAQILHGIVNHKLFRLERTGGMLDGTIIRLCRPMLQRQTFYY